MEWFNKAAYGFRLTEHYELQSLVSLGLQACVEVIHFVCTECVEPITVTNFSCLWHSGPLQWRHNECDGVSNHRRLHCLLKFWFMRRSKKTSKLRVTGLCAGKSPVTGEFPAQKTSVTEYASIWWRHHEKGTGDGVW